jgi:hypothetical protein
MRAERKRERRARALRVVVLSLAAGTVLSLSISPSATGHPRGCVFPQKQPPVGDTRRVYAIPHGCVRLAVPRDDTRLPTVVARQHDRRGRAFIRRVRLPATNLDRANGSVGICGHDSTYVFVVAYPFVTVVAQELYDLGGGRRECALEVDRALLWTGMLSSPPSFRIQWYTHRKQS